MKDLHLEAGLVRTDDDFSGQPQYIGTRQQWEEYDRLEEEYEQQSDEIENQQYKYGESKS